MLQNTKTEDETQALRETECAEIHTHAETKEKVTIKWLESRFQQQQEEITRVNVPSIDILEWRDSFPLIDTCSQTLDCMKNKFDEGEEKSNKRKHGLMRS